MRSVSNARMAQGEQSLSCLTHIEFAYRGSIYEDGRAEPPKWAVAALTSRPGCQSVWCRGSSRGRHTHRMIIGRSRYAHSDALRSEPIGVLVTRAPRDLGAPPPRRRRHEIPKRLHELLPYFDHSLLQQLPRLGTT